MKVKKHLDFIVFQQNIKIIIWVQVYDPSPNKASRTLTEIALIALRYRHSVGAQNTQLKWLQI